MHDALPMRAIERGGDLGRTAQRLIERERALLEARRQRLALEMLQHQEVERAPIGGHVPADVVQRADVRMIERGHRARLALEALPRLRVAGDLRRQHLDRDAAIQPRVPRPIHLPHAARRRAGR